MDVDEYLIIYLNANNTIEIVYSTSICHEGSFVLITVLKVNDLINYPIHKYDMKICIAFYQG